MESEEKTSKIKAYWDEQAEKHGTNIAATMPDSILKGLEIQSISNYLKDGAYVLDIGCGNGYSTIEFAKKYRSIKIVGVDYSEKMINAANDKLDNESSEVKERIRFEVGDVLNLNFESETFDIVTTDRCLINLTSMDEQIRAISEIHKVLKKNGQYIMCEDTKQGLEAINELRKKVSLYEIPMRWHNLYIDEKVFLEKAKKYFRLVEMNNFSSLYYIASRIFNAKLAEKEGKEPSYTHPINYVAADLPSIGNAGPLKIFLLERM